jgi:hypothetical protein
VYAEKKEKRKKKMGNTFQGFSGNYSWEAPLKG